MVHTGACHVWWLGDLDTGYQYHIPPITARCSVSGSVAPVLLGTIYQAVIQAAGGACHLASSQHRIVIN